MKFRTYGIFLSLFFALGLVFSFSVDASASHDDGTGKAAGDVDPTSKADVEAFLDHIIDYWDQVVEDAGDDDEALTRGVIIYGRDLRREGPYKHSATNMYSMGINERETVTNHARYPNLLGYKLDSGDAGSAVGSTIQALIDGSGVGMTECETYGDQGRVACATKVGSQSGDVTVIAGLHHEADDSAFALPKDCAEFMLTTNAEAVFEDPSDANLEAYVKSVIETFQQLVADITAEVFSDFLEGGGKLEDLATNPVKQEEVSLGISARLFDKTACLGSGDFKHENIYAFVMDANLETSTVLLNGNNFDLNGSNLELHDDSLPGDDKSIAGLFNRALEGVTNAYVNYRWDDPTTTEDDVEDFFRNRKVPGTSCKRSYIELADLNARTAEKVAAVTGLPAAALASSFPLQRYIFGSGTYPGDDVCASGDGGEGGDDDGCTIAGAGRTSQSTWLNLFLVASVLFSVVFLRKRT